jgi:hypothetical protein
MEKKKRWDKQVEGVGKKNWVLLHNSFRLDGQGHRTHEKKMASPKSKSNVKEEIKKKKKKKRWGETTKEGLPAYLSATRVCCVVWSKSDRHPSHPFFIQRRP